MGVRKKQPPVSVELERLQAEYVVELGRVLETYSLLLKLSEGDVMRHRQARLRADCLRFEYLRLFKDPVRAEEAWVQHFHPLYAMARGYK